MRKYEIEKGGVLDGTTLRLRSQMILTRGVNQNIQHLKDTFDINNTMYLQNTQFLAIFCEVVQGALSEKFQLFKTIKTYIDY